MKYKLLTFALLPILAITLTACTLRDLPLIGKYFGGGTTGPVKLTMWGFWDNPEVMNALIAKYQETHPNVTISYEDRSVLNVNDYKQAVFTRVQQKDLPDIVRVHQSWVPRLKDNLIPMPASLMDTQTYQANFYPIVSKFGVMDNKVYSMPRYYDGLVLVYNKNHFAEIGQSNPPESWEEFRRLALQLTVRSGGGVLRSGAAMGTAKNIDMFSDILGLLFEQAFAGTSGVEETIPQDLDSRSAQDALTFYVNFLKEDKVWSEDLPDPTTAFVDGKVSMVLVPAWRLLDILNAKDRFNFVVGVAPVPQALPENPAAKVTWGSYWVDVVPNSSPAGDTAWDFLNFISSSDSQLFSFSETSKMKAFGAPYSLVTLAPQLKENAFLAPLVDTAPFAKGGEISARAGNRKQVDALAKAVTSVLNGGSPDVALKAAKAEMMQ